MALSSKYVGFAAEALRECEEYTKSLLAKQEAEKVSQLATGCTRFICQCGVEN